MSSYRHKSFVSSKKRKLIVKHLTLLLRGSLYGIALPIYLASPMQYDWAFIWSRYEIILSRHPFIWLRFGGKNQQQIWQPNHVETFESSFFCQHSHYFAIFFRIHSLLFLTIMYQKNKNDNFIRILLARKRYLSRKDKILKKRSLCRRSRSIWFKTGRTDHWWRNMISTQSSDQDWKSNFRMSRELFFELVEELRSYISPDPRSPNYRAIKVLF